MRRRDLPGLALSAVPTAGMHIGGDYHSVLGKNGMTSRENLEYNLRFGVRHLTGRVTKLDATGGWDAGELMRMRDDCERHGVKLEAIRMEPRYITLPRGAERDREVERIQGNIAKAARAGVQVITYHWTVIPIRRNRKVPGRGGVTYEAFKLEQDWAKLPVGSSGKVSSTEYWDRIGAFLEKVIPVAKEHDVRMGCHPYDPPGLPLGYQGAENWDAPDVFAALKRYEKAYESPYNGFQVCLGTVAEGLKNPARELPPIVRYLGGRGKIFQVHMRNIKGGLHDFAEVFPDEGDVDLLGIMRILRETRFAWSICPDHMPHHPDDPGSLQAFAFGYGYLKALLQAVS